MAIEYIYPPFEVIRRDERCTRCRICEKQCANGVHTYDAERKIMLADESKCVNCQLRCALPDARDQDRKNRLLSARKRELEERHDPRSL